MTFSPESLKIVANARRPLRGRNGILKNTLRWVSSVWESIEKGRSVWIHLKCLPLAYTIVNLNSSQVSICHIHMKSPQPVCVGVQICSPRRHPGGGCFFRDFRGKSTQLAGRFFQKFQIRTFKNADFLDPASWAIFSQIPEIQKKTIPKKISFGCDWIAQLYILSENFLRGMRLAHSSTMELDFHSFLRSAGCLGGIVEPISEHWS